MSGSLMRNTRAAGQHGSPVENQPREEGSAEDEDLGRHRSSTASSTGHRICPPRAPLLLPHHGVERLRCSPRAAWASYKYHRSGSGRAYCKAESINAAAGTACSQRAHPAAHDLLRGAESFGFSRFTLTGKEPGWPA